MTPKYRYHAFSIEELYALEHEARGLRARAVNKFFRDAISGLKRAFSRNAPALQPAPRTVHHA